MTRAGRGSSKRRRRPDGDVALRRPLSFAHDEVNVSPAWEQAGAIGNVAFMASVPGRSLDVAMDEHVARLRRAAAGMEGHVEALRALVAAHEPVELLSSIAIPTSMAVGPKRGSLDDAAETLTWPAKVEYLLGVALAMPAGTAPVPPEATREAMRLLDEVFTAALARHTVDACDAEDEVQDHLAFAAHLLGAEHIYDRMPGYAVHLERVDAEVFDRHRAFYVDALGFSPGDVACVVRRRVAASGRRGEAAFRAAREAPRWSDRKALATIEFLRELDLSRRWDPDSVAADTGTDAGELDAMLGFFSASFGEQPSFRTPMDWNIARARPCVATGDGSYFVADPWALLSAVHLRMTSEPAIDSGVLARYRKHREHGHERLVAAALRQAFGSALIYPRQHYTSTAYGPGEVDVLVATPEPLVVEAKAASLTDLGRRGRPDRVSRVVEDVVARAASQTSRARFHVVEEEGTCFADRQGGPTVEVLPTKARGAIEVVVTFERMDPVTMHASAASGGAAIWAVCVADLLMIVDLVSDPAAFHHYAATRAEMSARGPVVFMESDALSAYLQNRLRPQLDHRDANPDAVSLLGYFSAAVNDYFTAMETGRTTAKPSTGVPAPVSAALAAAVHSAPEHWSSARAEVMAAPPTAWRAWRSFSRRHSAGEFKASDRLALVLGEAASLEGNGSGVRLVVPRRARA